MPTCLPISELKDARSLVKKVAAAGEPVIITRNGYEEMIVMDPELFRSYRRETAEEQLERLLQEADRDVMSGDVSDALSGIAELRASYGL